MNAWSPRASEADRIRIRKADLNLSAIRASEHHPRGSALAVALSVGLLGLEVQGPVWLLTVVAIADAVLGSALGLFVSAFATTEFQAVQFMPAFVVPQILLCGLFIPREQLPPVLEAISNVLPLSYATDAMQTLSTTSATGEVWQDVAIVTAFALAALGLGAATLRRRTP